MNSLGFRRVAIGLAVALIAGLTIAASPEGVYHLLKKYDLGAAPGGKEYWDYITFDPASRRLYLSHNAEVKVVDADSGKIVGSIVETVKTEFGARNAALDHKEHRIFIDTADFGPTPAPTTEQPNPQPTPVSGTFRLLVYGR